MFFFISVPFAILVYRLLAFGFSSSLTYASSSSSTVFFSYLIASHRLSLSVSLSQFSLFPSCSIPSFFSPFMIYPSFYRSLFCSSSTISRAYVLMMTFRSILLIAYATSLCLRSRSMPIMHISLYVLAFSFNTRVFYPRTKSCML